MEVVCGRVKLGLDPGSGAVVRLHDTVTGRRHLDPEADGATDARLLRINVPHETWSSRYADGHAQRCAEVERRGPGVSIGYPDLIAAGGEALGIRAQVDVVPSDARDEVLFRLRIENRGPGPL